MPLIPPVDIARSDVISKPVTYSWDSDIGLNLFASKDKNPRLYVAIDEADFRSKMGLGMAITEWVVWRLSGLTDVTDALLRVEAGWTSLTRPALAPKLRFDLTDDHVDDPILGPLEQVQCNLGALAHRYATGYIYLAEVVVRQATLARHVMPDKKVFDGWLSSLLRSLASARPRGPEYDESSEVYDYSHEAPVSRDAFGDTFQPAFATAVAQEAFLQSLDPATNPYLTP